MSSRIEAEGSWAADARPLLGTRLRARLAVLATALAGSAIGWLLLGAAGDVGAQYTTVSLLGAAVGIGELVSRYRDRPWKALRTGSAIGYVLLNSAAAAGALGLIFTFDWTFGADPGAVVATQLLVAGFGSMALFRTSLFTVRAGDQDVGIGPSSLLSIILAACDRGVDRERAKDRALVVHEVMHDVSFARAHGPLPTMALALMQNLEPPDQAALGLQVEKLANDKVMTDSAKSLLLGLAISNAVGPHVLRHAKQALGADILRREGDAAGAPPAAPAPAATAPSASPAPPPAAAAPAAPEGDSSLAMLERMLLRRDPQGAPSPTDTAEGLPQTPQTP